MNALFSLILSSWFAFRQGAKLDSSDIYVPHPWRRTWLAIAVSSVCTPALIDALIDRQPRRSALLGALMLLPYLSSRLDPNLRKHYHFEYVVGRAKGEHVPASENGGGGAHADGSKKIPRSESSFI